MLKLFYALMLVICVGSNVLAQKPGPMELSQGFLSYGRLPDGTWASIETMTMTEERGTDENPKLVQATILHAYEITGNLEAGKIIPEHSYVKFNINGLCPHPDMPYVTCYVPGDFHSIEADEDGRYYAVPCLERSLNNTCISLGDNFFTGITMDKVDGLPSPPKHAFHVEPIDPVSWGTSYRGYMAFHTIPYVAVVDAAMEVRHIHPETGPGPVIEANYAARTHNDITKGWVSTGSPRWDHVGTWCEIVPEVIPHGGDYQQRFRVRAIIDEKGTTVVQYSEWVNFKIQDCRWAPPQNPADLNGDGVANIFDLGIFRFCFLKEVCEI